MAAWAQQAAGAPSSIHASSPRLEAAPKPTGRHSAKSVWNHDELWGLNWGSVALSWALWPSVGLDKLPQQPVGVLRALVLQRRQPVARALFRSCREAVFRTQAAGHKGRRVLRHSAGQPPACSVHGRCLRSPREGPPASAVPGAALRAGQRCGMAHSTRDGGATARRQTAVGRQSGRVRPSKQPCTGRAPVHTMLTWPPPLGQRPHLDPVRAAGEYHNLHTVDILLGAAQQLQGRRVARSSEQRKQG